MAKANSTNIKYGLNWAPNMPAIAIEREMIRGRGFKEVKGRRYGNGLFYHYKEFIRLLWPEDDQHRWFDLGLRRICENEICVFMGASDSGKTYLTAAYVLADWWAHCDNTLWMVSSTELRGAELRIWGKLKELFNRGRQRYPWLPGVVLESKHAITTEEISDDGSEARLLTKGIIFIPCKSGSQWVGLGSYAGVKPTKNGRLGHAGDEASFMNSSFLDAYANWYGKPNFKGLLDGNPTDMDDVLCTAAEPVDGWDKWEDNGKTQEWRSKFYGAWVIAFDGRDSPNFDDPSCPAKFPYLIGRKKLDSVGNTEGLESPLFWMQCVGKPRKGTEKLKVITRLLCEQNRAFEDVVWAGSETTQIAACDAAYGGIGGDRCVLIRGEFGSDVEDRTVLAVHPPVIVPVSVLNLELPEDQIARFSKRWCEGFGIPPENFFFDARSTLAIAFAKVWSPEVNAVDFGGTATKRPVSSDEFVLDAQTGVRRLKRCDEHYSKFVTELWFSVRYAVLSKQLRQLPREVAAEGYKREWKMVKGNRIEVESKVEMKLRTKQSPDLFDSLVTMVEGARRKGFSIEFLKEKGKEDSPPPDEWLEKELQIYRRFVKKHELSSR